MGLFYCFFFLTTKDTKDTKKNLFCLCYALATIYHSSGCSKLDRKIQSNELSIRIIPAAIEVHRQLGPGLLESAYQAALAQEFGLQNIPYIAELAHPVEYKGKHIDAGYRIDFLVDNLVLVELKSVAKFAPVHEAQLLTYLKLSGHWLGILFNFNSLMMKQGIRRIVNGDPD